MYAALLISMNRFALVIFAVAISMPLLAQQKPSGQIIEISPPKSPTPSASVKFERLNLGPNVNSEYGELCPILSPDETTMFFTRQGDPHNVGFASNPKDEDIWYSLR